MNNPALHQSMVHLAVDDQTNQVIGVKVSAFSKKASFKYLDKFLVKLGHNKFTMYSINVLTLDRVTKPFEGLMGAVILTGQDAIDKVHAISTKLREEGQAT